MCIISCVKQYFLPSCYLNYDGNSKESEIVMHSCSPIANQYIDISLMLMTQCTSTEFRINDSHSMKLSGIFYGPEWEAYSNRTVRPSVRASCVRWITQKCMDGFWNNFVDTYVHQVGTMCLVHDSGWPGQGHY